MSEAFPMIGSAVPPLIAFHLAFSNVTTSGMEP